MGFTVKQPDEKWAVVLCFLMGVVGVAFFAVGFRALVSRQQGADPDFASWGLVVLSLVLVGMAFFLVDDIFEREYPLLRGFVELGIGLVVTGVNIAHASSISISVFCAVLVAGVAACFKGLKDILGQMKA